MFNLSTLGRDDLDGGINLIDLGASGKIPPYWAPLARLTNVTGFDPNREECERLNLRKTGFGSQRFLPYAIAGTRGTFTLHKTRNMYCWSLLKPNLPWLRRFTFSDLFEVDSTAPVEGVPLGEVAELKGVDVDAIKLDVQGLELPILESSRDLVRRCIWVETESGFTENYHGESTFEQVAAFMRSMGFGLFDLNGDHRVPRKNPLSARAPREQMLWCEAVWLRDFAAAPSAGEVPLTRAKALKTLLIHANHGCHAFGLETAGRFRERGLLSESEYRDLETGPGPWTLGGTSGGRLPARLVRLLVNLIPRRLYGVLEAQLTAFRGTAHPWSTFFRSGP